MTEAEILRLFDFDPDDPEVIAFMESGRAAKAARDAEEANYRVWTDYCMKRMEAFIPSGPNLDYPNGPFL